MSHKPLTWNYYLQPEAAWGHILVRSWLPFRRSLRVPSDDCHQLEIVSSTANIEIQYSMKHHLSIIATGSKQPEYIAERLLLLARHRSIRPLFAISSLKPLPLNYNCRSEAAWGHHHDITAAIQKLLEVIAKNRSLDIALVLSLMRTSPWYYGQHSFAALIHH